MVIALHSGIYSFLSSYFLSRYKNAGLVVYQPFILRPSPITFCNSSYSTPTTTPHTHTMNKIKTAGKASILNTKAKSTKIGLKETESNRVSIADDNEQCWWLYHWFGSIVYWKKNIRNRNQRCQKIILQWR